MKQTLEESAIEAAETLKKNPLCNLDFQIELIVNSFRLGAKASNKWFRIYRNKNGSPTQESINDITSNLPAIIEGENFCFHLINENDVDEWIQKIKENSYYTHWRPIERK